jgi:diguanylate cyclase (GGDEF)-like protein
MFDLNHLKEINDNYGHSKGDEYIRNFAEILKKILPKNAEAIRTGGDEFLVIIPKFNRAKCEAFLSLFIEESKQTQVQGITESAAYGFAVRTTGLQSEEEVIAAADKQKIWRRSNKR